MLTVSLKILDRIRYREICDMARDNGSLASLIDQLMWLTYSERVELRPHPGALEFAVAWYREDDDKAYMHGGLIFHSSDNTWSVHT